MPQQWEFFGGTDDAWHWRLIDADTGSLIRQSQRGFLRLFDCAKDAGFQGYGRSGATQPNEACAVASAGRTSGREPAGFQ
jgi:hypothetical protein